MFYLEKPVFDDLEAVALQVGIFEKQTDILLKIKHLDPSKLHREYV
jgi:hypothetical protein